MVVELLKKNTWLWKGTIKMQKLIQTQYSPSLQHLSMNLRNDLYKLNNHHIHSIGICVWVHKQGLGPKQPCKDGAEGLSNMFTEGHGRNVKESKVRVCKAIESLLCHYSAFMLGSVSFCLRFCPTDSRPSFRRPILERSCFTGHPQCSAGWK